MTESPRTMSGARPAESSSLGTPVQRARVAVISLLSGVAGRLPDGPLNGLADAAGELWYRVTPARAALARRNLRRVCLFLAAEGRGPERARRAATDPAALERLVRSAYRHSARYYLEALRAPWMTRAWIDSRVTLVDEPGIRAMLNGPRPVVIVSLHWGALETPAIWLASRTDKTVVVPMETVGDPALHQWFKRTRSSLGLRIIPIRGARQALTEALARGDIPGLVADRDIAGGGLPIPLFGHPTPLPVGPALLTVASGLPAYVGGVGRVGGGRYRGALIRLEPPTEGSHRERIEAFLRAEARIFEDFIASAPDQWLAVFHPLWKDLVEGEES